ncbi:aldehyde dehydrogenase [Arthrobacter sp. GCM10027362]|uniref:aldehyde dehydrogenase n=1 Tax=Arthrobacter sp. GCM10027362 TaxID=3273379 RepID=UPI00362FF460
MVAGTTHDNMVRRDKLFIAGAWQEAAGHLEVVNPANLRPVGVTAVATTADAHQAVSVAQEAFAFGVWRMEKPSYRAAVLREAADILERKSEALVSLVTDELGCTVRAARTAAVPNPIRHLRYYADLIESTHLEETRSHGGASSLVVREPVGVVAAITPWNAPLFGPTLKVAPALAAGCSVVLKPALEAPLSAYELADAFAEAGLPPGVLSIIPGDGAVGEHLVTHPGVDKVAFTGSTAVGRRIMALCGERIARVSLELGGKSAAVILDDADIETVAEQLLPMILLVNGQACIAQSRVLVPRSRKSAIVEALADAVAKVRVGNPYAEDTTVGPLVSERQLRRVEEYIGIGVIEGARVVVGGGRPSPDDVGPGYYFEPTLLSEVENNMRVAQEEIFGPVLGVIEYADTAEAVAIANDSVYGLSGSVWTGDPARGLEVARQLRTGMVSINGSPQAFGSPFGGFKQSGIGREMGPEGLQEYLETKSIALGDTLPTS